MRRWFARFGTAQPYLFWLILSFAALMITRAVEPYTFAFTAFACAAISAGLLLVALTHGPRIALWAMCSALPTALAFALLSTYSWA